MNIIKGDLIQLAKQNYFDAIIHGCNCFCKMGAGIAKTIKHTFPNAYKVDSKTISGDKSKLGTITFSIEIINQQELFIVNAYTQYDWRGIGVKIDYKALSNCFEIIKKVFHKKRIAYPMIGSGLAGGDWNIIKSIIDNKLQGENHSLVVYCQNKSKEFDYA